MVDEALEAGDRILLEGQLGTMRDIDWGTYPYRDELQPDPRRREPGRGAAGGAASTASWASRRPTPPRSAAGPLPTELDDADGDALRERGIEYGTSTGRPRRCGWYDAVAVRFSVRLAGYSSIALTKLDVLDAYERAAGSRLPRPGRRARVDDRSGVDIGLCSGCEPVYEELPGWQTDTTACRSWGELPQAARDYVERLEELAGVPISHVSIGPERDQMIEQE